MQRQNLGEYEFIRKELSELRNCITTYMGFVIGGSGIVFFGIAALSEYGKICGNTVFAFLISSIIVSLVLIVLFYKFNSYNRYAGYCKLLNQEKYDSRKPIKQFISWEVCIDILREADFDFDLLLNKAQAVKDIGISENVFLKIIEIYDTKIFPYRFINGVWLLVKTLVGQGKTKSWNFPLYIVSIFFVINILHIIIGLHFYFSLPLEKINILLTNSIYSILVIQLFIWGQFMIKFYDLTKGKSTIESFCWRFLPIRYEYIRKQSPEIHYSLITLK